MTSKSHWGHLNNLQLGRYAEYLFKMRFVRDGFDVYTAEVDDRGIDFVLRLEPDRYWDVQVKSIRNTGYVFMPKSKFRLRANLMLALAIFTDSHEPDLYLRPAVSQSRFAAVSNRKHSSVLMPFMERLMPYSGGLFRPWYYRTPTAG